VFTSARERHHSLRAPIPRTQSAQWQASLPPLVSIQPPTHEFNFAVLPTLPGPLDSYEALSPRSWMPRKLDWEAKLEHDANGNPIAGIRRVTQVISVTDVININVIGVVPTCRPRLNKSEPIAAILKARISANHPGTLDAEFVPSAKIGTEAIIGYTSSASSTEPQCRHCALSLLFGRTPLSMLPWLLWLAFRLLLLLSPLLMLLILGLLLWLPSRGPSLLLTLGLLFWLPGCGLSLLLTLGLLLWLPSRGPSLLLLLFRLGFLLLFGALIILFVLALLSVRGSKSSEKKEQNSRADKSNWFHECFLQYGAFMHPSPARLARLLFLIAVYAGRPVDLPPFTQSGLLRPNVDP
jgi:hypothetical protein